MTKLGYTFNTHVPIKSVISSLHKLIATLFRLYIYY